MTVVTYAAMSEDEYEEWNEACIIAYANDKQVALNISNKEAMKLSTNSFRDLLANGLHTKNHYIFNVINDENTKVGYVWYAFSEEWGVKSIFLFDIEMMQQFRGQGYGKATMEQLEQQAKNLGASKISLHVFGQNNIAKSLYDTLDYQTTDVSMSKELT